MSELSGVDELNSKTRERLLEEAASIRKQIIDLAFNALKIYLAIDQKKILDLGEEQGVVGQLAEHYVMADIIQRPEQEDRLCLTFRLEDYDTADPLSDDFETGPVRSIDIYVPIPEGIDFTSEEFDVGLLKSPEVVYMARNSEDEAVRFAIGLNEVSAYIPEAIDGVPTDEFDAIQERLYATESKVVESGLPMLTKLLEDMVNMRVVVRTRYIIGEDNL